MSLKILSIICSIILIATLSSCDTNQEDVSSGNTIETVKIDNDRAKELLKAKCYVCHNPKIKKDNLLAPPMIEIKEAYKSKVSGRDEFVNRFVSFISAPSKENSVLKNAVEEYGLMAYQGTKKKDLEKIARYVYDEKIEEPSWWNNQTKTDEKKTPRTIGMNYALSTKKALGKQLMKALEKGGPEYAVEFCNTRALPITDSLSRQFNAQISRVSDQPRNQSNKANSEELKVIEQYKALLASNEKLSPILKDEEGSTRFYFPIKTNGMCLKCHGEPGKEINQLTLSKLDKLYPDDKAKGYDENQIRGIWSILFKNTSE